MGPADLSPSPRLVALATCNSPRVFISHSVSQFSGDAAAAQYGYSCVKKCHAVKAVPGLQFAASGRKPSTAPRTVNTHWSCKRFASNSGEKAMSAVAVRPGRYRFRARRPAGRRGRGQDGQTRGRGRGPAGGGRRMHQHRHHPLQNHARGRAPSLAATTTAPSTASTTG